MSARLDMLNGIKPEISTWYYEVAEKMYSKIPPQYQDIVEMVPEKDFTGGYWKGTSAIGAGELDDLADGKKATEDLPQEGFTVYGTLKQKALKINSPQLMERDWFRTKGWLKDYVQKNWTPAVEVTKEKIVARMYLYGGYTAGHAVFNNDNARIALSTYTSPNLAYDGSPFLNGSGSKRANKSATGTYYNNLVAADLTGNNTNITYDHAVTAHKLLTTTNNFMENGNPFDNGKNIVAYYDNGLEHDWKKVENSVLNPDNAANATNTLAGVIKKFVSSPYLAGTGISALISQGKGIKAYFGKPRFIFWEENDPETIWGKVVMDYAIWVNNWRPVVTIGAPTSA